MCRGVCGRDIRRQREAGFGGEQLARSGRSNQRRVMGDVREKQPLSVLAGPSVITVSNDDNSYSGLG